MSPPTSPAFPVRSPEENSGRGRDNAKYTGSLEEAYAALSAASLRRRIREGGLGLPGLLLAYDADCGSCTRFRHFVEFLDLGNRIEFISLVEADDSGLLDPLPKAERHTSFHLILPDGTVLSGAAAIPPLVGILLGGAPVPTIVASMPGASWVVSHLYLYFSRAHDGAACGYPGRIPGGAVARKRPLSEGARPRALTLSSYLAGGLLGGFVGSLVMGLFVRIPDALCVGLAKAIAGTTPTSYPLAWTFHEITAVLIGATFGYVASLLHLGDRKASARSVLFGLGAGLFVWSAFFAPLMLYFLPRLLTRSLLEASLLAHLALGLALGATLAATLRRNEASAVQPSHP